MKETPISGRLSLTRDRLLRLAFVLLLFSTSATPTYASYFCYRNGVWEKATGRAISSNEDWLLDTTVNNVDFYYRLVPCGTKKTVLLRFVNRNTHEVLVTWTESFVSKQVPQETQSAAGKKHLTLKTGETSQPDCTDSTNPQCLILPQQLAPTYVADILSFKFNAISVSNVQ